MFDLCLVLFCGGKDDDATPLEPPNRNILEDNISRQLLGPSVSVLSDY